MRYHYEKPETYHALYAEPYQCDHEVYSECTLFRYKEKGLAVIQQRYDYISKHTWWGPIDEWLIDDIYLHDGFYEVLKTRSGFAEDGIFPTMSIRQLMWALKMKPLKRERWETVFDRKDI